ncbi:MAG TPA: hypothetical protein VFU86_09115 [Terriglobales bacterium]|nr:hypothetical protein [Terriglobales bacterium]
MSKGTVGTGWNLVWRHKKILFWVFAVNLLLGALATNGPRLEFSSVLDHRMQSARLANGFDLGTFVELVSRPDINMTAPIQGSILYSGLFFLFMLFIVGGILTAYREDRPLFAGEFFGASGEYFWRMVRIFLMSLIPYAGVAAVTAIIFAIASGSASEKTAFQIRMLGVGIGIVLVLFVRLWFDVAQVRAVAQNEHGMFRDLLRAFAISLRGLGTLLWMYLRISIVAWVLLWLGLWTWNRLPGNQVWATWLLLEVVMFTQVFARLWQRAASVRWYGIYAEEHPVAVVEFTTPHPVEITEPRGPSPSPDPDAESIPPSIPPTA